jgi:hypothetical protein
MKKERRARATPSQLQVADMKASCLETGNASRTRKELIKDVTSNGFPVRGAFEKWLMIYRYDEIKALSAGSIGRVVRKGVHMQGTTNQKQQHQATRTLNEAEHITTRTEIGDVRRQADVHHTAQMGALDNVQRSLDNVFKADSVQKVAEKFLAGQMTKKASKCSTALTNTSKAADKMKAAWKSVPTETEDAASDDAEVCTKRTKASARARAKARSKASKADVAVTQAEADFDVKIAETTELVLAFKEEYKQEDAKPIIEELDAQLDALWRIKDANGMGSVAAPSDAASSV